MVVTLLMTHKMATSCFYSHVPQDYQVTLEELLQAGNVISTTTTATTPTEDKSGLSPNGMFKYFEREVEKCPSSQRYGRYVKSSRASKKRIRRPLNCFMVFSHLERKGVADEHPELHNADLSKILGKRWKGLSSTERQPYIAEAERIRQVHSEMYPDYKYQPRRKGQGKKLSKTTDDNVTTTVVKNENENSMKEGCDNVSRSPNILKETDLRQQCEVETRETKNLSPRNDYLSSYQHASLVKNEFAPVGGFPDYNGHGYYDGEQQNDVFIYEQKYTYQNIEHLHHHQSSPNLSPVSSQNGQIGQNGPHELSYNCTHSSQQQLPTDIISQSQSIHELINNDVKPIVFPNYCKENVNSSAYILPERMEHEDITPLDINYVDTGYVMQENDVSGNHDNILYRHCGQSYLRPELMDDEHIDDGYLRTTSLTKSELSASFSNIVESLQNIR